MTLTFKICGQSHIGYVKTRNEDRFLTGDAGPVLAVADGLGGNIGGAQASAAAVQCLADALAPPFRETRREVFVVHEPLAEGPSEIRRIGNLRGAGAVRFLRAALRSMLGARSGSVVAVSSVAGLRASPRTRCCSGSS